MPLPLSCNGPSLGLGLTISVPVPTVPLAPERLPIRLLLLPLMLPSRSGDPPIFPATIEFFRLTLARELSIPPT